MCIETIITKKPSPANMPKCAFLVCLKLPEINVLKSSDYLLINSGSVWLLHDCTMYMIKISRFV